MANLDLYGEQTGMAPTTEEPLSDNTSDINVPRVDTQEKWLDARALLDVEGLKTRTGTFA